MKPSSFVTDCNTLVEFPGVFEIEFAEDIATHILNLIPEYEICSIVGDTGVFGFPINFAYVPGWHLGGQNMLRFALPGMSRGIDASLAKHIAENSN